MTIELIGSPELVSSIEDLLKVFLASPNPGIKRIELQECRAGENFMLRCIINQGTVAEAQGGCSLKQGVDPKRLTKVAFLKAMYMFQQEIRLPWGILTGIRPTKIVHRLFDQGLGTAQIAEHLSQNYLVAPEKIELITRIAQLQRKYLLSGDKAGRLVSVYIGIPFCPSRCLYCSFPSTIGTGLALQEYLVVLQQEIGELGRALRERNLHVQSLYIGGGTPTILDAAQLGVLLTECQKQLIDSHTVEITVEAGRPDTLDRDKLALLKSLGVGRLSINPQTMVEETLRRIGRNHTPGQIVECFNLARNLGFENINMDIILGLPGESLKEVGYTLGLLEKLKPDSLTVHALAVKKGSTLKEELGEQPRISVAVAEELQELAFASAKGMGLIPYYLYRQKQILGNLENVGYALSGKESIYNIQIMEERQSIFALGAGAATKIVNPRDWSLVNLPNPKQPEAYYRRWRESLTEKIRTFDGFNQLP